MEHRRGAIASVLLFGLGASSWVYPQIPIASWQLGLLTFAVIGFCTYGAHVMMVAAMPVDFSVKGGSASATGFIDGFGYLGATLVSVISGFLIDN